MLAKFSCAGCTATLGVGDISCPSCGRQLSLGEREAREATLEATNPDYADAKATIRRALLVSLVAGLLTLAFAGARVVLGLESGEFIRPNSIGTLVNAVCGAALVACFFTGRRAATNTLWVATASSHVLLVFPYFLGPTRAMLEFVSPGNVALTLARLGALILLIQGLSAALVIQKLRRRSRARRT
jgi:hypothetical protein